MMVCVPAARAEVAKEAEPETRGTVVSVVEPSRNAMLPGGVPAVEVTTAVKVTLAPGLADVAEAVRAVDVEAGLTVNEIWSVAVVLSEELVGVNVTERVCGPALSMAPAAGV